MTFRPFLSALLLSSASFAHAAPSASHPVNAAPAASVATILDQPLQNRYHVLPEDIHLVLSALSRMYNFNIVTAPDVAGDCHELDITTGTVRDALTEICETNGYFFEQTPRYIEVKKYETVLYTIEYPKLSRSTQANTSVTFAPGNSSSSQGSTTGTTQTPGNDPSGSSAASNNSASSLTITQVNKNDVWDDQIKTLSGFLQPDEKMVPNAFSGIVAISATRERHRDDIAGYIAKLNHRIRREVRIEAKLVEIATDDAHKFGVDYSSALASIGALNVRALTVTTNITSAGSTSLPSDTLIANLGVGKVTALLHALESQGDVESLTVPTVTIMHNQTAVLNVSDSLVTFSVGQTFNSSAATATSPFVTSLTTNTKDRQSFGQFFPVTVHIADDGLITVTLEPRISVPTELVKSPDGTQTALNSSEKSLSTVVSLKSGDTAILGGLCADTTSKSTNGLPYVSNIPWVGSVFRTKATSTVHTEFAIILTATLIDNGV